MAEQRDHRDGEESADMVTQSQTPPSDEPSLESRKQTYQAFMRLIGFSTAGVAIVLVLLAIFLL